MNISVPVVSLPPNPHMHLPSSSQRKRTLPNFDPFKIIDDSIRTRSVTSILYHSSRKSLTTYPDPNTTRKLIFVGVSTTSVSKKEINGRPPSLPKTDSLNRTSCSSE